MASKPYKPYTEENTYFARICRTIVELCRDALWDILSQKIPPADIPAAVVSNLLKLGKLHDDIKAIFQDHYKKKTLPSSTDVDVGALYTIFRNIIPKSKLKPPTKNWGAIPGAKHIKEADDIERIREIRNSMYGHIRQAALAKKDYLSYTNALKDIFKRIDGRLGTNYVKVFDNYRSCVMDPHAEQEYRELLKKQIEYDEETRERVENLKRNVDEIKCDVDDIKGGIDQLQVSDEIKEKTLISLEARQQETETNFGDLKSTQEKQTGAIEHLQVSDENKEKTLISLEVRQQETETNFGDLKLTQENQTGAIEQLQDSDEIKEKTLISLKTRQQETENKFEDLKSTQTKQTGKTDIKINVNQDIYFGGARPKDRTQTHMVKEIKYCADPNQQPFESEKPLKSKQRSYSEVVRRMHESRKPQKLHMEKNNTTHEINVNVTNVNIAQQVANELSQPPIKAQYASLKAAVNDFKDGHFVLICCEMDRKKCIEHLAFVPWTVVFDFDPDGRSSGMLSVVEEKLHSFRSLYVHSLFDKTSNITESSTHWLSMQNQNDSNNSNTQGFGTWNKNSKVSDGLKSIINNMKSFANIYTRFRVILFWPADDENSRYVERILQKLEKHFEPGVIVIDSSERKTPYSSSVLSNFKKDLKERLFHIQLTIEDVCSFIQGSLFRDGQHLERPFVLPVSKYKLRDIVIDKREASWLQEVLDVLFADKQYDDSNITARTLEIELDNFYRGGTLPWFVRYELGSENVDAERDVMKSILKQISELKDKYKSSVIRINHTPGCGGTTLAQRILWELKDCLPCVQVRPRESYMINDVEQRLLFLYKKTDMPILVLLDGEDEHKLNEMMNSFENMSLIVLCVVRYPYPMTHKGFYDDQYWLDTHVSHRESNIIAIKLGLHCKNKNNKDSIRMLNEEVKNKKQIAIFEFGLAAFAHEYAGIASYVSGFLRLEQYKDALEPWHTALAILSFTYYYGQIGMPCQFFTELLQFGTKRVPNIHDFPKEMQALVVPDTADKKQNVVRISHYFIAKEILEQTLSWPEHRSIKREENLYLKDKRDLEKFAIAFIKRAENVDNKACSHKILTMITKCFISRDSQPGSNKRGHNEKKKRLFSRVLSDLENTQPYTSRFKVYSQLTKSFPNEAPYHAQLGRLFTLLLPQMEDEAEKHLKKALELCDCKILGKSLDDIPRSMRMTLMMTNHMYGRMFKARVEKFTGKNSTDRPALNITEDFIAVTIRLLQNVTSACKCFQHCRYYNPQDTEDTRAFEEEICTRLLFCDFVSRNSDSNNVWEFLKEKEKSKRCKDICDFLNDCIYEIDSLFLEYFSSLPDPDDIDRNFRTYQNWYTLLFKKRCPGLVVKHDDSIESRRSYIAQLKIETGYDSEYGNVLKIDSLEKITSVIKAYEKNFDAFHKRNQKCSIRDMDIDYREWLVAIRHKQILEPKSVEEVLQTVEHWYTKLNTPTSRFYVFILKSIIGFGTSRHQGNTPLLLEAKDLRNKLSSYSKYVQKARSPREWLGTDEGIRCLEFGQRYTGRRDRPNKNLALFKGTICHPNNNPRSGAIHIDHAHGNSVDVKAFFVPLRSNMDGPSFAGRRVEFYIAFSYLNGYEAFIADTLKKVECPKCKVDIEVTSRDVNISCPPPCSNTFKINAREKNET